jgi:hypothetical protein
MEKIMMLTNEIKALQKCISKDATRYILNAIYITDKYMAATDGRRLLVLDQYSDAPRPAVVPAAYKIHAVSKINKIISEVVLEAIEGQYPDIESVIPSPAPALWSRKLHKDTYNFMLGYNLLIKTGRAINIDYLEPLRIMAPDKFLVHTKTDHETDATKPLLLSWPCSGGRARYIVLPVTLDLDLMAPAETGKPCAPAYKINEVEPATI